MNPGPRPRRVLMTTDAVGGVWRYSLELARGLCGGGVELLLATLGPRPDAAQRREAQRIRGLRLCESDYALEWMPDPWRDVDRAGHWLLALERSFRPDVVHLCGYAQGALPWRAPTLLMGHSCVFSWWEAVHGELPPAPWRHYHDRVATGLAGATLVAAPTRAMLASLQRHYGPLARTRVVPNGRFERVLRPQPKQPLVFASGRRWDEAKNLALLESVAARLSWPVVIAGPTRKPADGASEAVRSPGALPPRRVLHWMRRAAIYALPARYEPFGLGVLEAASAHCALVLGDIESLRELWEGAAIFLPVDDGAAWGATLARLAADDAERGDLARRAALRAARFPRDAMVRATLACYRELLAGVPRRSPPPRSAPLRAVPGH